MIDELAIHNIGLLAEAHIEPGPGFVVVTGETGAGKTMLLGALPLLCGRPAGRNLIGPAASTASVEGRLAVANEETVVRRRIGSDGRGRAYMDGKMVPARALADRMGGQVAVVAQGDVPAIARSADVLAMIDACLDEEGRAAASDFTAAWSHLKELRRQHEVLSGNDGALERELDVVAFQADEIAAAGFSAGDDEALEAAARRLRHGAELGERLAAAHAALGSDDGAAALLAAATAELEHVAELDDELTSIRDGARQLGALASELTASVAVAREGADHDPARLDEVEARISALRGLQRKYGATLEAVLSFGAQAQARRDELAALQARARSIEEEVATAEEAAAGAARTLGRARRRVIEGLGAAAAAHLSDLGLVKARVEFRLDEVSIGPRGADRAALYFASGPELQAQPVAKGASGGELTRIVLALRLATGTAEAPIVVFDEVDAGVGGATALAMGAKLARLAQGRQVLCVTHLPQVAAFADNHLVVERSGAQATVRAVTGAERVAEVSRMLGGLPDSERGRDHAEELIALAAGR